MIEVLYTCDDCGVKNAKVSVRDRGVTEDVSSWVEGAMAVVISQDHRQKSPLCSATHMTQVKIPLAPHGGRIGDPTSH
jgi:hypothetical protein